MCIHSMVLYDITCTYPIKGRALLLLLLLQDKQNGSASLAGTPLADITPRHQQLTPVALASLTKQPSSKAAAGAGAGASVLTTPAVVDQENVEEQCLSAGRWLRGLAEECLENVYTPARLQPVDAIDDTQVGCGARS